jgi:hypothetical protein
VVELADAPDSKSGGGNSVWVQLPPPAPYIFMKKCKVKLQLYQEIAQMLTLLISRVGESVKVSGQKVEPVGAPFFTIRTSPRPLGGYISAVFTDI